MAETKRFNYLAAAAANLNAVGADTITQANAALIMSLVKSGTLSALVAIDAESDGITIEALWQISNDNVTFYEVVTPEGAKPFAVAAGTAGADATVTVALQAPDAVYGALYARVAVRNRFVTGAAADTYVVGYNFTQSKEVA